MKAKQQILHKLMHVKSLSFNDLWDKNGESNTFAYHIKALLDQGLIEKTEERYVLSSEGKAHVALLDGETGKTEQTPLFGVLVVLVDNNNLLFAKRLKHPFYGYYGMITGKIKFDENVLDAAKRELLEETGLEAELEIKGMYASKTFENNNLVFNNQLFVIKGINPSGKLIEKTREGECMWVPLSDINTLKVFPGIKKYLEMVNRNGFSWIEAVRELKDGVFVSNKEVIEKVIS